MQTPIRTRVVVSALVVVLLPYAVALETETPEPDTNSSVAMALGRADEMSAWSVDSGGGQSSGGGFIFTAAIGQPDAGVVSQGDTVLSGGIWSGATESGLIFYDGFESSDTGAWSSVVGGAE